MSASRYCPYGYPLGGPKPRVRWCALAADHDGLCYGADDSVGFTKAMAVRREPATPTGQELDGIGARAAAVKRWIDNTLEAEGPGRFLPVDMRQFFAEDMPKLLALAKQPAEQTQAEERSRVARWLLFGRLAEHGMPVGEHPHVMLRWIADQITDDKIGVLVCVRCHERAMKHMLSGLCEPCHVSGGHAAGPGWDDVQPRLPKGSCGCIPAVGCCAADGGTDA